MKKIILIKLGGSLITDKDKPYTAREAIIDTIASELKDIIARRTDCSFVLGNGAGSFGHYPAEKYKIKNGITNLDQVLGFAVVQDGVGRLNRLVIASLLKQKIAACSLSPSSFLTSLNGKKQRLFTSSLFGLLQAKVMPVVYGDIVSDAGVGCHIFSTEDLFALLIPELKKNEYQIEKIIHLTSVAGVLDKEKQVIPLISKKNINTVRNYIFAQKGFDVTGGMLHKINTALLYAKNGIPTYIIEGGNSYKLLTKAVFDKAIIGTKIT